MLTRALVGVLLAIAPVSGAAQSSGAPAPAQPSGIIAGTVRDEGGRPVPEAIVTVDRSARQTRTDSVGRFALERVPIGIQDITIRRIGFRPARAELNVRADSATIVSVTLVADPQRLGAVRIEEQLLNQLSGVVIDEKGEPVAGAEVDIMGLRRSMLSDADGRFLFVDLATGNYMVEVRKEGYRIGRRAVQMVARIERDLAIRLYAGEDIRNSVALARVLAQEADRRRSLAGTRAAFVTRAELERWKDAPLLVALRGSSGGQALVDLMTLARSQRSARGPQSFDTRGKSTSNLGMDGSGGAGLSCVLVNGNEVTSGDVLSFFRASEVELVELFPAGSEHSRTFCGRFPPSTGCQCPPDPAGLVIWLKR